MVRIRDLNVSDIFYWEGRKYSVFMKIKYRPIGDTDIIPCLDHPMPDGSYDMPAGRLVKPVIRLPPYP